MQPSTIDLTDPDLYASGSAMEVLGYLQKEHPVYRNVASSGEFWALTRYADAVSVYRDHKSFTSRYGIQVGQVGQLNQPASGKMLVLADREEHRRIKAIMSRHLAPAALERLLPTVDDVVRAHIRHRVGQEPFDFVGEVAIPVTLTVMSDLIGIPPDDRRQVSEWAGRAFGSTVDDQSGPASGTSQMTANAQLFTYFSDLLADKRARPGVDLLSALVDPAESDGQHLSDEEILFNLHLLLAGGHETARQALVGTAAAFADHPGGWSQLVADPSLATTAIEEVLRWSAPSLNVMRTATQDTSIGGQRIAAGEQVTIWNPVVNRDEEAFPRAAVFDIARKPNRHMSFGMSSHFCLGAWLARREMQVLLQELIANVTRLELAGEPRRLRSNRTWGYAHLPLKLIAHRS